MADTIRELIIQGIASNLANIRTSGGYNSECGIRVVRSSDMGDIEDAPGIAFEPKVETGYRSQYNMDVIEMPVSIVLFSAYTFGETDIATRLAASQMSEKLLGDAKKAMGQALSRVDDIIYNTGGMNEYPLERNNQMLSVVETEFLIKYQTVKNDPYTQ